MAELQLSDGRTISFPNGLTPEQVKKIVNAASGNPAPAPPPAVSGTGFDAFKARLESGQIKPVNAGTTMADMGQQFRKGLVQGAAGMAAFPEVAGDWLANKAVQGIDYLRGVEHQPAPAMPHTIPTPGDVGQMLVDATGIGEAKTTPGRYMNRFGQFLPSVAIGGPAGMGEKVLRAGTASAGAETAGHATKGVTLFGVDVQPYAEAAASLAGNFVPDVVRRSITPFPVNPERERLLGVMRDEGVPLTAGQRTGREGLGYAESELGGGSAARTMERQGEQFTAAALRRVGIDDATRATPEVMDRAFTRLGNQFDALASRNRLPPDPQIATDVANAVTDYAALVPASAQPNTVRRFANDLLQAAQSGLTGAQYQAFRSRLTTLARNSSDPQLRGLYRGMSNALDDAMERSLAASGSPDLGAWQTVRNQYRNMLVIEQAATASGKQTAEGIISPSALRNATVQKQGRRNYARGDGDFADLSRAGEATMKPLPNSGTAGRQKAQRLGAGFMSAVGSGLGGYWGGGPGALLGFAAGGALPYAAGQVLMSRPMQAWLGNHLFAPETRGAVARSLPSLLGTGSTLAQPSR